MNCQKFEAIVSELARNQMMEADTRVEALEHSDDCAECADRLRDQQSLSSNFAALATDMASLQAPPQLESTLREAFRHSKQVAPLPIKKQANRRYWLTAIAAMFLIMVGLGVVRWRMGTGQEQIAEIPAQSIPNFDSSAPVVQQGKVTPVATERRPQRRQSSSFYASNTKRHPVRNPAGDDKNVTREVATEFMALSYMNAANFQDGGQIVRVELPRSALASFGLPVNMDRYNEKVKADVLYGVDGLAHAIRFVQ